MRRVQELRARKKQAVRQMIALYCRKKHGTKGELCAQCRLLAGYAGGRIDRCPYSGQNLSCSRCPVHCYRADMRKNIRAVMRFAGPRMLLYHPVAAVRHMLEARKPPRRMQHED